MSGSNTSGIYGGNTASNFNNFTYTYNGTSSSMKNFTLVN